MLNMQNSLLVELLQIYCLDCQISLEFCNVTLFLLISVLKDPPFINFGAVEYFFGQQHQI